MSRLCRRGAMWVVAAGVAALTALAGCGADGSSSATIGGSGQTILPAVSGTVWVPPGTDFAAIPGWRKWLETVLVAPRAYAEIPGEARIQTETWVTLNWIIESDAADGKIDSPRAVSDRDRYGTDRTDQNGSYTILSADASDVDACRMYVSVGHSGKRSWTRAFVFDHATDLDAVSEAVVRMVLQRLTEAPPVQLCDFSSQDLRDIYTTSAQIIDYDQRNFGGLVAGTIADTNANVFNTLSPDPAVRCLAAFHRGPGCL
jgi:hypothetical protein